MKINGSWMHLCDWDQYWRFHRGRRVTPWAHSLSSFLINSWWPDTRLILHGSLISYSPAIKLLLGVIAPGLSASPYPHEAALSSNTKHDLQVSISLKLCLFPQWHKWNSYWVLHPRETFPPSQHAVPSIKICNKIQDGPIAPQSINLWQQRYWIPVATSSYEFYWFRIIQVSLWVGHLPCLSFFCRHQCSSGFPFVTTMDLHNNSPHIQALLNAQVSLSKDRHHKTISSFTKCTIITSPWLNEANQSIKQIDCKMDMPINWEAAFWSTFWKTLPYVTIESNSSLQKGIVQRHLRRRPVNR